MDNEELLIRIEELESRLDALEQSASESSEEDVCPECGEDPCVCDTTPGEDEPASETEIAIIDNDDVDEVEELNFDLPRFMVDDSMTDDDEAGIDGGLYPYEDEDEEDSPYYN